MTDLEVLHKEIRAPGPEKKPTMVIAHFKPSELDMMDHLQGGTKRNSAGVRTYNPLYHGLLKHGPIKDTFLDHARIHNANGGSIQAKLETMRRHGRHGDSEVAYIPHGLAEIFDKAIGGRVHNPHDGHPEYFSLSGKLAPLMDMFSRGTSQVGNFARSAGSSLRTGAMRATNALSSGLARAGNYIRGAPKQTAPISSLSQRSIPPLASAAPRLNQIPNMDSEWKESDMRRRPVKFDPF